MLKKIFFFVAAFLVTHIAPTLVQAQEATLAPGVVDYYGKAKVPAYLVAEYPSGRIISGKNIDTQYPIASLTKLLTAYTAVQEGMDFSGTTTFRWKQFNTGRVPVKAFRFSEREMLRNEDVLALMLVISNNSASRMVALATGLGEEDFIASMNRQALSLGMNSTTVFDTSGLNNANVGTARDLLTIFNTDLADPRLFFVLSRPVYSFEAKVDRFTLSHLIHTSNLIPKLYPRRHYDIVASKTGWTGSVATMTMLVESKISKKQFVIITLNNPTYTQRFLEPHKIAEWVSKMRVAL